MTCVEVTCRRCEFQFQTLTGTATRVRGRPWFLSHCRIDVDMANAFVTVLTPDSLFLFVLRHDILAYVPLSMMQCRDGGGLGNILGTMQYQRPEKLMT